MYKYFSNQALSVVYDTSSEKFSEYKRLVLEAMAKLGASKQEMSLLQNATLINSIARNRKPEDVAWAVLQ